jgi:hypothetical protein
MLSPVSTGELSKCENASVKESQYIIHILSASHWCRIHVETSDSEDMYVGMLLTGQGLTGIKQE